MEQVSEKVLGAGVLCKRSGHRQASSAGLERRDVPGMRGPTIP